MKPTLAWFTPKMCFVYPFIIRENNLHPIIGRIWSVKIKYLHYLGVNFFLKKIIWRGNHVRKVQRWGSHSQAFPDKTVTPSAKRRIHLVSIQVGQACQNLFLSNENCFYLPVNSNACDEFNGERMPFGQAASNSTIVRYLISSSHRK